jgi:hypothetical protein
MAEHANPAISRIINYEVVEQHFGYWPDFHDAEITKVTFESHPTGRYSVTLVIAAFEMTNELDKQSYYKLVKHCKVELQFIGIQKIKFRGFDHQNVIFDLAFEEKSSFVKCTLASSNGLESFVVVAEEVSVLSLVPTEPIPDEPLIDIISVDMMDAKNIFIASEHLLRNFDWSDWIYVGLNHEQNNEYKADTVAEYANSLFDETEVYLVIGRHDSHLTTLSEALGQVSILLKGMDVLICNKEFSKAIRFRMVGVMSYGEKRN